MTYQEQYTAWQGAVEQKLDELTRGERDSRVLEAMRYSLLGGGKRVRAVLCLAVCALCGGEECFALLAASALEMLHCYSLIHDDLPCMDDDALRRGKPSCHRQYGEATALLAGDGLLTLAFHTLAEIEPPESSVACARILGEGAGVRGMIHGQELDLDAEGRSLSLAQLEEVHRHKTGALLGASVAMGAAVAGAGETQRAALYQYAEKIGLVFQIVDDILDCTSSTEVLGKPVGSDERQKKNTYPALIGLERSREAAEVLTAQATAVLERAFGDKAGFLCRLAQQLRIRIN